MTSLRSCKKCPPSSTEPVSNGSKMDLLLARAEHISDGGKTAEEQVPISSLSRQDLRKWHEVESGKV